MAATIRSATAADAAALASIYAPIVEETAISFETTPPTAAEMRRRLDARERLPWLVCERDGEVVGYAYASPHSSRSAYQWSVHVSVYVREDARRCGVARGLYEALLEVLRLQGIYNALAVISLPNPPSVAFHESMGFERAGVYRDVGHKHGKWRDVGHWQLSLRPPDDDPDPPTPAADLRDGEKWAAAMEDGAASIRL
jgi:phosphinothricin acetyltransferase